MSIDEDAAPATYADEGATSVLPDDVILTISQFMVSLEDRFRFAGVCRRWRSTMGSSMHWHTLSLRGERVPLDLLMYFIETYTCLEELDLSDMQIVAPNPTARFRPFALSNSDANDAASQAASHLGDTSRSGGAAAAQRENAGPSTSGTEQQSSAAVLNVWHDIRHWGVRLPPCVDVRHPVSVALLVFACLPNLLRLSLAVSALFSYSSFGDERVAVQTASECATEAQFPPLLQLQVLNVTNCPLLPPALLSATPALRTLIAPASNGLRAEWLPRTLEEIDLVGADFDDGAALLSACPQLRRVLHAAANAWHRRRLFDSTPSHMMRNVEQREDLLASCGYSVLVNLLQTLLTAEPGTRPFSFYLEQRQRMLGILLFCFFCWLLLRTRKTRSACFAALSQATPELLQQVIEIGRFDPLGLPDLDWMNPFKFAWQVRPAYSFVGIKQPVTPLSVALEFSQLDLACVLLSNGALAEISDLHPEHAEFLRKSAPFLTALRDNLSSHHRNPATTGMATALRLLLDTRGAKFHASGIHLKTPVIDFELDEELITATYAEAVTECHRFAADLVTALFSTAFPFPARPVAEIPKKDKEEIRAARAIYAGLCAIIQMKKTTSRAVPTQAGSVIVSILAVRKLDVNYIDPVSGLSLLHMAAYYAVDRGSSDIVEALLQAGANPNIQIEPASAAAALPALPEKVAVASSQLSARRRWSHPKQQEAAFGLLPRATGSTPLHLAALRGANSPVVALLAAGAQPNVSNGYGLTPLQYAFESTSFNVMLRLLRAGAAPVSSSGNGRNLLQDLVELKSHQLIDTLLHDRLVDANAEDNNGVTPLMMAAEINMGTICHALLRAGADPNAVHPRTGRTALLFAMCGEIQWVAALALLNDPRTNVHAIDRDGCSVLYGKWKDEANHKKLLKRLLDAGVSTLTVNRAGETALQQSPVLVRLLAELQHSPVRPSAAATSPAAAVTKKEIRVMSAPARPGASRRPVSVPIHRGGYAASPAASSESNHTSDDATASTGAAPAVRSARDSAVKRTAQAVVDASETSPKRVHTAAALQSAAGTTEPNSRNVWPFARLLPKSPRKQKRS